MRSQFLTTNNTNAVVGISSNGNYISLPNEIFNTLPVRIASFIYQNMSSILVPRNTSLQLVSPVISATTDCEECKTTDLIKPVGISFNVSSYKVCCTLWSHVILDSLTLLQTLLSAHFGTLKCKH